MVFGFWFLVVPSTSLFYAARPRFPLFFFFFGVGRIHRIILRVNPQFLRPPVHLLITHHEDPEKASDRPTSSNPRDKSNYAITASQGNSSTR